MAYGLHVPLMITLVLGSGVIRADAANVVDQAARSVPSQSTNRRSLRAVATTSQHLLRATSHAARLAAASSDQISEHSSSSSSSSSAAAAAAAAPAQPPPAPKPEPLMAAEGSSAVTQPPTYSWMSDPLTEEWLQLQRYKVPAPPTSPPVHLTVSLTAGVAFQARTAPAPALLRGFGAEEDCGRMAALVGANLTAAAAAVGMRFAAPPVVERCDGTWFSMRVPFGIESSDCGALSDAVYRELPRWVNAALGRAPETAVACGGTSGAAAAAAAGEDDDDEESFTTAWAYGNGDGAARDGCVALAYTHVC